MDRNGMFLTVFLLCLLIVDCYIAETDIKKTDKDSVVDPKDDKQSGEILSQTASDSDSAKTGGKKGGASEGGTKKEYVKNVSNKQQSSDGNGDGVNKKGDSDVGEKIRSTEGLGSNGEKGGSSEGHDSKPSREENSGPEECDASSSCTDEKNKLVACLQVPGNESPDLSLLIQNKGIESLTVKISAPTAVHLEKTTVQLLKKEDAKVKVSIGSGVANDSVITLKAGLSVCELNFRDIAVHNSVRVTDTRSKNFTIIFAIYMLLAALVLGAVTWACIKCQQRRHGEPKYQKLDMELPVSSGGKMETDATEGWDTNWGDSWDDEEAPMTPQPSSNRSSKGLASRRSNNKEGWHSNWKD